MIKAMRHLPIIYNKNGALIETENQYTKLKFKRDTVEEL